MIADGLQKLLLKKNKLLCGSGQSCSRVGLTRGTGRVGLGRVGSGILRRTAGPVGSGPDPGGSGRVGSKNPDLT